MPDVPRFANRSSSDSWHFICWKKRRILKTIKTSAKAKKRPQTASAKLQQALHVGAAFL